LCYKKRREGKKHDQEMIDARKGVIPVFMTTCAEKVGVKTPTGNGRLKVQKPGKQKPRKTEIFRKHGIKIT